MMRNVIAIFLNAKDANSDIIYSNFWSAKVDAGMKINKYQKLCMRTAGETDNTKLIIGGAMGLCGKSIDLVKKWCLQGRDLDCCKVEEELGDVLRYIAILCEGLGIDMERVMKRNIQKTKKAIHK